MASANFTYDDAIQAVRERLNDDAQRRTSDEDILNRYLPGVLAQLRADRPDLWYGTYGTETYKPGQMDAIAFDDAGFESLVDALYAAIQAVDEESARTGLAGFADMRSERARKS